MQRHVAAEKIFNPSSAGDKLKIFEYWGASSGCNVHVAAEKIFNPSSAGDKLKIFEYRGASVGCNVTLPPKKFLILQARAISQNF